MPSKKIKLEKIKRILIIRPDVLGDVVLSTPVIHALKKHFPEARLSMLLRTYTRPLLESHPMIDEILIDEIIEGKIRSLGDFLRYAKRIREHQFDLMITLWEKPIYALLGFFAGIPYRVGDKNRLIPRLLYNYGIRQKWWDLTLHQVEHNLRLLQPLGIYEHFVPVHLNLPTQTANPTNPLLIRNDKKKISISLGTTGGKRTPTLEQMSQVMKILTEKGNVEFILLGTESEQKKAETLQEKFPDHTINWVGKTDIPTLMYILHACDLPL